MPLLPVATQQYGGAGMHVSLSPFPVQYLYNMATNKHSTTSSVCTCSVDDVSILQHDTVVVLLIELVSYEYALPVV